MYLNIPTYPPTHLLSGDVLAAEGDGVELAAPAGEGLQAGLPGLKALLQERHRLPGLLLHVARMGTAVTGILLALSQTIQLSDH